MEAKRWPLFSECRLERDGYPAEQDCFYGTELANLCPENKRDALSRIVLEIKRKASITLWLPPWRTWWVWTCLWRSCKWWDRMQSYLKMKPELVPPPGAIQDWGACRLVWVSAGWFEFLSVSLVWVWCSVCKSFCWLACGAADGWIVQNCGRFCCFQFLGSISRLRCIRSIWSVRIWWMILSEL